MGIGGSHSVQRFGWVMFPAEVDGWQQRQPARGMDPLDVREVPLRLGFNTGLPDTATSKRDASVTAITKAA
jgi:hypothetical protein